MGIGENENLREAPQSLPAHIPASNDPGITCQTFGTPKHTVAQQRSFSAPHLARGSSASFLADRDGKLQSNVCPAAHLPISEPLQQKPGGPMGTDLSLDELRSMVRATQLRCFEHFHLPRPRFQTGEGSLCGSCPGFFDP